MAIVVGQEILNPYEGVEFEPENVDPDTVVPEGQVDLGNLINPLDIVYSGGNTITGSNLIRTVDLVEGTTVVPGYFYEYNDVIYRCLTQHYWNNIFDSTKFKAQGNTFEKQVFQIANDSTTSLTLSTSAVGQILFLTVNGIEFIEDIDFTKGGTGNKTLTFNEALPYNGDYGNTYVKVTITPLVS